MGRELKIEKEVILCYNIILHLDGENDIEDVF